MDIIEKFLKYVADVDFEVEPNYSLCRDILRKGLPATSKGTLFLDEAITDSAPNKSKKTATKRRSNGVIDHESKKICVPVPMSALEDEPNPKRLFVYMKF